MTDTLNTDLRQAARDYCGDFALSQTALASAIGATRHAVRWFLWADPPRDLSPEVRARLVSLLVAENYLTPNARVVAKPRAAYNRRKMGRPCKAVAERRGSC
jgi:hypothetical protein